MNTFARRPGWVAIGLLGLLAAAASAQEKYTLKPSFKTGQTWTFEMDQSVDINMKILAAGQVMAQVGQEMRGKRSGKAEVLEAVDGVPVSVRVAYSDNCRSVAKAAGQSQEVPFALAGKTVTIKRGVDGRVSHDSGLTLDDTTLEELKQFVEPDTAFYPKDPVAVGGEWKGDPRQLAKAFQLKGKDDVAELSGTLVSVKEVDGRKTAEVKLAADLASTLPEGFRMKIKLSGNVMVDIGTGQIVDGNIKGPIGVSGDMRQPGPDGTPLVLTADGDGTATFVTVNKLQKAGTGGGNEKPVVNPLENVKPAATGLAGTYTSAQITIELSSKGNDDYAGTITMGDKKFPLTGHYDSIKGLNGHFEAGGAKFVFNAMLEGNTLTFTTEGTKYELKKDAPKAVNPLSK